MIAIEVEACILRSLASSGYEREIGLDILCVGAWLLQKCRMVLRGLCHCPGMLAPGIRLSEYTDYGAQRVWILACG